MPLETILGSKTYLWDIAQFIFWACVLTTFIYLKHRERVSYLEAMQYMVGFKRFKQDFYTLLLMAVAFVGFFGLILYGNLTRGNI